MRPGIFFTNDQIETLMEMNIDVPEVWLQVDRALNQEDSPFSRIFVTGPPGVGKTYLAYQHSDHWAITLSEETPSAELRGHWIPKGGDFLWHHGPVPMAMVAGGRLVINEISHAGPDVLSFLHPVLEKSGTNKFTLPTGELMESKDGFHVVVTDNMPLEDLPEEALKNRFDCQFSVDSYSPMGLAALSEEVREWAQKTKRAGEDGRWISLRQWVTLDQSLQAGWDLKDSCWAIWGQKTGDSLYSTLQASRVQTSMKF